MINLLSFIIPLIAFFLCLLIYHYCFDKKDENLKDTPIERPKTYFESLSQQDIDKLFNIYKTVATFNKNINKLIYASYIDKGYDITKQKEVLDYIETFDENLLSFGETLSELQFNYNIGYSTYDIYKFLHFYNDFILKEDLINILSPESYIERKRNNIIIYLLFTFKPTLLDNPNLNPLIKAKELLNSFRIGPTIVPVFTTEQIKELFDINNND